MIYDLHLPYSRQMIDLKHHRIHDLNGYSGEDLLLPVFRNGRRAYDSPGIHQIRERSLAQQAL